MSAPRWFEDVSDTARWVAYYRALESERPDALFQDRFARRLAGERGQAIAKAMPPGPLSWAMAVRTRVYDELILEAIQHDRVTAVLNLAAGMDARPYRLPLPESLHWIEMDLPAIVAAKESALATEKPSCQLKRVGLDLTDRPALGTCLAQVASDHARVLVITEGLLVYLSEADVRGLAEALHSCPAIRSWVLDVALPEVLARSRKQWGKELKAGGAEMKFAPATGVEFFRDDGWQPRVKRSCLHEARRLGREARFASLLRAAKSLTKSGREWLQNLVVYAVVERIEASTP